MTKNKPQRERFEDTARDLDCDEDEDRFNETLKRIVETPAQKNPHGSNSSTK